MIYVKDAGSFKLAKRCYIKDAGNWVEPSKIWVKDAGTFKMVHATATISVSTRNVNVASIFGSPATKITAILNIANGVIIGSNSTSNYALDTTGLAAGSLLFLNIGSGAYIVGKGGDGGVGGGGSGSNGFFGGPALNLTVAMTLTNSGTIGGGGGGGAGGATWPGHAPAIGGGGGGAGDGVGVGGVGYSGGGTGSPGTLTTGGADGGGHCNVGTPSGGSLGVAGYNTSNCDAQPGATGGAAGKAINLNGNTITYALTGTILGAVS